METLFESLCEKMDGFVERVDLRYNTGQDNTGKKQPITPSVLFIFPIELFFPLGRFSRVKMIGHSLEHTELQ